MEDERADEEPDGSAEDGEVAIFLIDTFADFVVGITVEFVDAVGDAGIIEVHEAYTMEVGGDSADDAIDDRRAMDHRRPVCFLLTHESQLIVGR